MFPGLVIALIALAINFVGDGLARRARPDAASSTLVGLVADPILEIHDLTVEFSTEDGVVRAVTGVSYDLMPGEVLGIVGESGSGKSVSMLTVLGLTPMPPGRIAAGEALYKGKNLLKMPKKELRDLRGGEMAMIFQDPMTSLNPVFTIGDQISEALQTHNPGMKDDAASTRAIELLEIVGVPFAERRVAPVSARVLGRHAPARDDRDGDGEQPERPHRRRADDRARRDDPGADRRGDQGGAGADATPRSSSSRTTSGSSRSSPTASSSCTRAGSSSSATSSRSSTRHGTRTRSAS